jgi:diguanylate cyclase (GGDEF)-like protein
MAIDVQALVALTQELQQSERLEDMLQRLVGRVAALLDVERASVRLLDDSRTRLLVGARAGEPVHDGAGIEFTLGEGLVGWVAQHAQPLRSGDALVDPRFVHRDGMRPGFHSFLGVPLMDGSMCIGVLSVVHALPSYFETEHEELLSLVAGMSAPYLQIARLRRLAEVDPLTGALNRRGLDVVFPDGPSPSGVSLSVAVLDLDHFKRVNDDFGHEVGDAAIRAVSHVLGGLLRRGDGVVRLGGEEFALVLPGASLEDAARVAERARAAIEANTVVSAAGPVSLTVSIGVAERGPDEPRAELLRRADEAMYRAKSEGRNRVCVA